MKIGEVAEQTGTSTSAIRYYEKIGLLPKPDRVSGQRVYDTDVLEFLEAIAIAQDLGFSLEEIKVLLGTFRTGENPSTQCRSMAQRKLHELDEMIANARRMKQILEHGLSCTCTSLRGCYLSEQS